MKEIFALKYCTMCDTNLHSSPKGKYTFLSLILFFFFFFNLLATLNGMRDLSSLTRDRKLTPCTGSSEDESVDYQGRPRPSCNSLMQERFIVTYGENKIACCLVVSLRQKQRFQQGQVDGLCVFGVHTHTHTHTHTRC